MASEGWVKSNLSAEETAKLQLEAARRVQEMRNIAQRSINSTPAGAVQAVSFENDGAVAPATPEVNTTPVHAAQPRYEMPSSRMGTHEKTQIIPAEIAPTAPPIAQAAQPRYEMPSSRAGTHGAPQFISQHTAAPPAPAPAPAPVKTIESTNTPQSAAPQYTPKPSASTPQVVRKPTAPVLKPMPPQTADISADKLSNLLALMAITDKTQNRDKALVTALLYLMT